MNTKPHIMLIAGRWGLTWQHDKASKTSCFVPFVKASNYCVLRNVAEGRCV